MHNPYSPPGTEVSDPEPAIPPRPNGVANACYLVVGALLLSLVALIPAVRGDRPDDPQTPLMVTLVFIVIFGGLTFWLAQRTYPGKNWARWWLLAYLVIGWLMAGSELTEDFLHSPSAGLINLFCIGLEAVAAWLLFAGPGAAWFARISAIRKGKASP